MASIRSSAGLLAASLVCLASLSHALPALGDFKYHGCYTNENNAQSLTGEATRDPAMALQKCASFCNGYQWFGVERALNCYCGTSLAETARKRPDTECAERCGGSRCQTCGGDGVMNVFWTGRDTAESSELPSSPSESESTLESTTEPTTSSESTTSAESTTTSEAATITETTASESITTTEPSTSPASTTPEPIPTTTNPPCELTTTLFPTPSNCWVSMPTACTSLTRSPAFPYHIVTTVASSCSKVFNAGAGVPTQIASCFAATTTRTFDAASAYACVQAADVLCRSETVCKDQVRDPGPGSESGGWGVNVLGEGGFEDGQLWPADDGPMGGGNAISASVSGERVHGGSRAMKVEYSNTNGASRAYLKVVRLEPGAEYEASWWWWSGNAEASTASRMQLYGGGQGWVKDAYTIGGPVGEWVRVEQRFVAGASFGNLRFSVWGNPGTAANTLYMDDLQIVRVG